MDNIFIIATVVSVIFLILKFIEMRFVDNENKPLKLLIRDTLLVYFSVIFGYFIMEQLNPVLEITGEKLFNEDRRREDGMWMGYHREYNVYTYEQLYNERWGIRLGKENQRLTVCYKDGEVGIIVRVATGELIEIDSLEAYKSMYQSQIVKEEK